VAVIQGYEESLDVGPLDDFSEGWDEEDKEDNEEVLEGDDVHKV
jgi:hypothetical protein